MDISQFLRPKPQSNDPKVKYYNWPKEISYYDFIPEEKKQLLRSVGRYLNRDAFTEILESYNDYEEPLQEFGYVQFLAENGVRTLKGIQLYHCDPESMENDYYVMPPEKVSREYHQFSQYGSQRFYTIKMRREVCEDFETTIVTYDSDGNVFVSDFSAYAIGRQTIDELGRALASCIQNAVPNQNRSIYSQKQKMKKNFRNCR